MEGLFSKLEDEDSINYIRSFDIIGLVETWLHNFDLNGYFENFIVYNQPATKFTSNEYKGRFAHLDTDDRVWPEFKGQIKVKF